MRFIAALLLLLIPVLIAAQPDSIEQHLQNLVIRRYTVQTELSLVGIKGKTPGAGLVYSKKSNEKVWRVTNEGKALSPEVTDVQAVAIVNDSIFLAGTWKNGFFRTQDAGASWYKLDSFPASDIRAIRISRSNHELIYASTVSHGIMKSTDLGNSWHPYSADSLSKRLASWSMEVDPENASTPYTLTYANGILRTYDQGKNWEPILKHEGIMFYDLAISNRDPNKLWAVGANDSIGVIYTSDDQGKSWTMLSEIPEGSFNQVALTGNREEVLLVGSWNNGAFIHTHQGWSKLAAIAFETISGIYAHSDKISFFTWGNGVYEIGNAWMNSRNIGLKNN